MSIMQVESGVQMSSMHKGRKTCYDESRDGNIHAIKVNALIVPSLQQDLIGGTNNLDFQVILDQDPNVAEIHPLINGKPYGDEQSIPFISDDLRLFQTKASHMANAAKVSRQPLNDATKKQSWRQKKRKSQSGDRDGQGRREHRSAAIISHDESATAWASNQDGRLVAIIKHTGASIGYDQSGKGNSAGHCAIGKSTSPPKRSALKENVPQALGYYVGSVLNKAPAGGRFTDQDLDFNEEARNHLEEMKELKARLLAKQAAVIANAEMDDSMEDMPELDSSSDSEDDESPMEELAKAIKAFLDPREEGDVLRLSSKDVSILEQDDPRHPEMLQLQRRIDGQEGSFRYISFGPELLWQNE